MANNADCNLDPEYTWLPRYTQLPNGETVKKYVRYSAPCYTVSEQRSQLEWYFHVNRAVMNAVKGYLTRSALKQNIVFPVKVNANGTLVYAFQQKLWAQFWGDCHHHQKRLPKTLKAALIVHKKEAD